MALALLLGAFALWWVWPRRSRAHASARRLLGVRDTDDRATIEAAFRARVLAAHPDHGGTAFQTQRLTAARDLLLGSKTRENH